MPAATLLAVAAILSVDVRELPSLRRAHPLDEQQYTVASLLSGDSRLLNSFFGTSFGGAPATPPAVHIDLCSPFGGAPAPMLLLLASGTAAGGDMDTGGPPPTAHLPAGATSMADVWMATLPLEGEGRCAFAERVCASAAEALAALGSSGQAQPPRRLVLLICEGAKGASGSPGAAEATASGASAVCGDRIAELMREAAGEGEGAGAGAGAYARGREMSERAGGVAGAVVSSPPPLELSHLLVPRGGAGSDAVARQLASMLLQPNDASYLLRDRPAFGAAAIPVRLAAPVLRSLLREPTPVRLSKPGLSRGRLGRARLVGQLELPRPGGPLPLPQTAREWEGLGRCLEAGEEARAEAARRAAQLREEQAEAALNPSRQFGAQLDELAGACLEAFDEATAAYEGTPAHSAARLQLRRDVAATCLTLARAQLAMLRTAAFDSFCGELVDKMHASRRYAPAARRLSRSTARAFTRAARSALPSWLDTRAGGKRAADRAVATLEAQLEGEVEARRGEGKQLEEQCPMPSDDRPTPWYRQIYVQLVGIAFNAAQFYLLQYLPAKRRDLANEREVPRGPLF
jgi:hypothetical protein